VPHLNCPPNTVFRLSAKLENWFQKSGVSLSTPPYPRTGFQSLPPTLRIKNQSSMPGYSKAPGVFPSSCGYPASLPELHFHRATPGDSSQVVNPFMRARTYLARDYATFGRLWLSPTFTGASDAQPIPCGIDRHR